MARVVVLGGRGNFGARICRALSQDPGLEVLAASRSASGRLQIDISSPDLLERLRSLSPDIVVHCVGPFQGQDYRVARAVLAAGSHYVDLSDGREFVSRFSERLDAEAKKAGRVAITGASTLPALSSAVIDSLVSKFEEIEEIQISIAPGQRAPRGAATLAAVLSYCGRPFKWLKDGVWRDAWGWQELKRLRFAGLGTRWAAACDVPDLEILPLRYPSLRTVEFRAALELPVQHFALWLAAALTRAGLPLPLVRWAGPLDRLAAGLNVFAGNLGGMLVSLSGSGAGGIRTRFDWHLTVDALVGPEIPCVAAILVCRRLAAAPGIRHGAFPCMGLLSLEDFAPEFGRHGITTSVESHSA